MLIKFIILFMFISCSHFSNKSENISQDLVTVESARKMAKQSYIRGCQENFVEKKDKRYQKCLNKSDIFIKEFFDDILNQK